MKRLCLLLALMLVLTGCHTPPDTPYDTATTTTQENTAADSQAQPVTLDIYVVNDLHGKLADTDAQPGVDELSTYLTRAQQNGNTILLSTGDMWQGASESNLTGGLIVTEWMNELNFAAMTIGGHEYDWGEEQIYRNNELAEFPFLGINIFDRETKQRVDYCHSSVVMDVDGVQIGIIGAIGNCYYSIASENTQEVYFLTGDALTALVKEESERLRNQGVDFIVYAIHDGYAETVSKTETTPVGDAALSDYYDVSLSDGYVDLVFEADSHYTYTLTDRYGVYHLQAGGNNQAIAHVGVSIHPDTGKSYVYDAGPIPSDTYGSMDDHPIVEELMDKYSGQTAPSTRIVGTNSRYLGKNAICQTIAYLYCTAGMERWGDTYDIVLGGGYISCRSPGYLPAGEVRYSQLMSLLPFDNTITLCSIRGRDLIDRFFETDVDAYYIKTTEYGETVYENVDPNGTYYVVTDSYTSGYAYNNLTVIDTYTEGVYARDLLADHIAAGNL